LLKIPVEIFLQEFLSLNICMDTNTTLTVADMASLRALIETAVSRGTYRPAELRSVGELYERLDRFVEQTQASLTQQAQAETAQAVSQGDQNA
jgi:hypothetical protein